MMKKIVKLAAVAMVLMLFTALLPLTASAADTFTLHASVPEDWDSPCFYGWGGSLSMSWPGESMTDDGDGWWSYEVPADATGLIVNGNNGSVQTNDIVEFEPKEMWVVCNNDKTFTVYYEKPEGDVSADAEAPAANDGTFMMYAYVPTSWEAPCFYGWGGSLSMDWYGAPMDYGADGWYSIEVPADAEGLIVNACGGTIQTPDIKEFEAKDMWVVVAEDTTFTLYYEMPDLNAPAQPEEPEVVASSSDPVVEDDTTTVEKGNFFADNIWLFVGGIAVIAIAAVAGIVVGTKKGKKN